METIEVNEITSSDLSIYKIFFRKGLILDERNFRISAFDDENTPFPTKGTQDSFTLGAYVNGKLGGVVSFTRDGTDREKLRHKGTLFRMYVANEFRGLGLSKILIANLLSRVKALKDIEQINLTVVANNLHAKKIYEKFGFKTFGSEERAIKWKSEYFTEDQMVLRLD